MTIRRSLPYLGIARRLLKEGPTPRFDHVINRASEALRQGLSDEEILNVAAKAEFEPLPLPIPIARRLLEDE